VASASVLILEAPHPLTRAVRLWVDLLQVLRGPQGRLEVGDVTQIEFFDSLLGGLLDGTTFRAQYAVEALEVGFAVLILLPDLSFDF